MSHRIILVLTLLVTVGLVAVGCTGSDTVREVETVKIKCPNDGPIVDDAAMCPDPDPPGGQPDPDPDPDPDPPDTGTTGRSACNIQVTIATSDMDGERYDGTPGHDVICGNERDDVIDGESGDDTIYGGPGKDILIGGDDRDKLYGEAGDDTLRGGQDDDLLDGGEGTDTADYSKENLNSAGDALEGGTPVDVDLAERHATDTYGDDDELTSIENVKGTVGDDTIRGDNGDNEIDGNGGSDTLDGRGGNDTIVVTASFDLDDDQEPADTISNFEYIKAIGSTADLALTGNSKRNKITANDGGNTLTGEAGNDELIGGGGADKLIGGSGTDTLTGGGGVDCFQLDVDLASLKINREMAAAVNSTRDRITDYTEGEAINVVVTSPTDPLGTRTIEVVVENRNVVVTFTAVEADSTADPAVPRQPAARAVVATGGSAIVPSITPGTVACP